MKREFMLACLATCIGSAAAQPGELIPHEFTVRLVEDESIVDIAESHGADVVAGYPSRRVYLLRVTQFDDDNEVEVELDADDRLESSERNRVNALAGGHTQSFFVQALPSSFFDQPVWPAIGVPPTSPGWPGRRITVAVLDTGVFPHPLFGPSVRLDGANYIDAESELSDGATGADTNGNGRADELAGHGTFIAGLVSRIAPSAAVLPVRVLDSDGVGTTFSVAAGIYYAIDHGASVINLSLTSPVDTVTLREAMDAARARGIAVVCAAGNNGTGVPNYPASLPGAVGVCSIDFNDQLAPWSSFGSGVTFAAPGTDIVSAMPPDQFASASGTSISAALVSGLIARRVAASPFDCGTCTLKGLWLDSRVIDAVNPAYAGMVGRAISTRKPTPSAAIDLP